MKAKHNKIDRRNFLKTIGVAGLGSVFSSAQTNADPNKPNLPAKSPPPRFPQVPRRKLGKTEVEVSCLSLGMMFNVVDSQVVLKKAIQWGVNYWDTAHSYIGGNSEIGIGKFLKKNPKLRKKLFIVSKASGAKTTENVEKRLRTSLERMNTNYIDLFYGVHAMSNPDQLTNDLRKWAESAKKRKLIRSFGFSTHKNINKCLMAASKLDWIDAIMTSYNFHLMQMPEIEDAIAACHEANIGLIAMKVTGKSPIKRLRQELETEEDKKIINHFVQRGFTNEQAAIKVVLDNEKISSACVMMQNVALLTSNVAAVLDKTKLTQADMKVFAEYAEETCSGYCAGCADICDAALPDAPYASDIMRYLMYYNSYGEREMAKRLFAQIPGTVRNKLLEIDYGPAEAKCPQNIPIGNIIAEAVSKLA